MDGIHDVGGEHGFGRVEPTAEEPPFEQDWEGRLVGIFRAIARPREAEWNADKFRFTREQLPPVATERFDRPFAGVPRFAAGDRVRAVLRVQPGHTRLPRYVRGHVGMVVAVHGAHVVPDENAQGRSIAEPLYAVAFALAELFYEGADSADKVHLELWERYLERIEPT